MIKLRLKLFFCSAYIYYSYWMFIRGPSLARPSSFLNSWSVEDRYLFQSFPVTPTTRRRGAALTRSSHIITSGGVIRSDTNLINGCEELERKNDT